jgi:hypothetical protein
MFASGANWARKFDPGVDADVFDILDQHVQSESVGAGAAGTTLRDVDRQR